MTVPASSPRCAICGFPEYGGIEHMPQFIGERVRIESFPRGKVWKGVGHAFVPPLAPSAKEGT
jgi:hypothetical protein